MAFVAAEIEDAPPMGMPAARVTDMHVCPMVDPGPKPHVGGPIIPPCAPTVLIGGLPAARVTDKCICVGPIDMIVKGSATVLIMGQPAARIGDQTTHGGVIITGQPNVLIGDKGGGGAGPGGSVAPPGKPCMKAAAANSSPFVKP